MHTHLTERLSSDSLQCDIYSHAHRSVRTHTTTQKETGGLWEIMTMKASTLLPSTAVYQRGPAGNKDKREKGTFGFPRHAYHVCIWFWCSSSRQVAQRCTVR